MAIPPISRNAALPTWLLRRLRAHPLSPSALPLQVKAEPSAGRAGDWTCPGCQSNVFASKSTCFKCNTAKPAASGGYGGGGNSYGGGGAPSYGGGGGNSYGGGGVGGGYGNSAPSYGGAAAFGGSSNGAIARADPGATFQPIESLNP